MPAENQAIALETTGKARNFLKYLFAGGSMADFEDIATNDVTMRSPVTPFKSCDPNCVEGEFLVLKGISDIVAESQAWGVLFGGYGSR